MKLLRFTTILAVAATTSAAFAGAEFKPDLMPSCYNEIAPFASKTAMTDGTATAQLKAETDLFRQTAAAAEKAQACYASGLDAAAEAQRAGRPLMTVNARVNEVREGLAFVEHVFSDAERRLSTANETLTARIAAELTPAAGGDANAADPAVADAQAAMADALNAFDLGTEMFDRHLRLEQRLGKIR